MSTSLEVYKGIIYGEPASKANSRKIVMFGKRPAIIKSQKARDYVKNFEKQCPKLDTLVTDDLVVEITIFYGSLSPDLDESVILDCMQGFIYIKIMQYIRISMDKCIFIKMNNIIIFY